MEKAIRACKKRDGLRRIQMGSWVGWDARCARNRVCPSPTRPALSGGGLPNSIFAVLFHNAGGSRRNLERRFAEL